MSMVSVAALTAAASTRARMHPSFADVWHARRRLACFGHRSRASPEVGNTAGMNGMSREVHQAALARRLADRVRRVRREVERIEAIADSPDGLVRATVGGHGQIVELDLNPRIFRDQDSRALADTIAGTIQSAQHAVEREISRLSREVLGA
jgi:DNA-binding protein YbaB